MADCLTMNPIALHTTQHSQLTSLPPLSLYVHIPWCIQKCPYCDFNSHTHQNQDENHYIQALLLDLQNELPHIWGRRIHSIFIGGGTPSVFSAQAIDRMLSGIRALMPIQPDAEITMEANPGTFERAKFAAYAAAGINRLSIGIQSFNDRHLAAIGRIHNAHEARQAAETALQLFPRVNLDLMYALPHQTPEQALSDLTTAIATGVSHISAYHLTMEPNTPFGHSPPKGLPEDDQAQAIESQLHQTLIQAGYEHYETSAFARYQHYGQHNLNYWQFGDYIGIGAGAHGKISSHNGIVRTTRLRHPKAYLEAIYQQAETAVQRLQVATKDLPFEFMMNALRLTQGVPSSLFSERTGLPTSIISRHLAKATQQGLLDPDPAYLRPTERGRAFLNDLLLHFL